MKPTGKRANIPIKDRNKLLRRWFTPPRVGETFVADDQGRFVNGRAVDIAAAFNEHFKTKLSQSTVLRYITEAQKSEGGAAMRRRKRGYKPAQPITTQAAEKGVDGWSRVWFDAMGLTGLSAAALHALLSKTAELKALVGSRSSFFDRLQRLPMRRPKPIGRTDQLKKVPQLRLHQQLLRFADSQWGVLMLAYEPECHCVNAVLLLLPEVTDDHPSASSAKTNQAEAFHERWSFSLGISEVGTRLQPSAQLIVDFANDTRKRIGIPANQVYLPQNLFDCDALKAALNKSRSELKFLPPMQEVESHSPHGMALDMTMAAFKKELAPVLRTLNGKSVQLPLRVHRVRIQDIGSHGSP